MPSILHLSDLHFTDRRELFRFTDISAEDLALRIVAPLSGPPDYLVISGDFTCDGDTSDFELAREFVKCLLKRLKMKPGYLAMAPGNHDIRWERSGRPASEAESRSPYRVFYRQLKQKEAVVDLNDFIVTEDLTLIALNSSSRESRELHGLGYVGEQQFTALWKAVQAQPTFNPASPRVAVLHHHLLPVTWTEPLSEDSKSSLTLDAEALQSHLLDAGFRVVLHGHQHQPFLRAISNPARTDMASLLIAGCGSTGSAQPKLGNVARNHYQMLHIRRNSVNVEWYESDFNDVAAFRPGKKSRYDFHSARELPLFIAVSGVSGSARTKFCQNLLDRLRRRYRDNLTIDMAPSFASDLIREGRTHDDRTTPNDYAAYLRRHIANLNRKDADVIILDRTLLDTLAFAELNGNLETDWLDLTQVMAETTARRMFAYFFMPHATVSDGSDGEELLYRQRVDDALWTVVQRYVKSPATANPRRVEDAEQFLIKKIQDVLL